MLADRRFGLHQQRAGIHRSRDAEHAGAGHIVARPDGSLHGGRATPMRQQREMQVVPAAGQRVQHGLLQDSSVCDDRGGLCAGDLQLVKERRLGRVGFQYRQSQFQRGSLDRAGRELASASGGRVRAGEHCDHFEVLAVRGEGAQGRHRDVRRAGKEDFQHVFRFLPRYWDFRPSALSSSSNA